MKKYKRTYQQILRIRCKPSIKTLEKEMIVKCKSIRNLAKKIKISKRDLPATIIGAVSNKSYKIDSCLNLKEPISPLLKSELLKIGNIGSYNGINTIGRCAENITANHLLIFKKARRIENIEFTNAYRPRTARIVKRCDNCIKVFGK